MFLRVRFQKKLSFMNTTPEKVKCLIIGGGPAGYTAGIYTSLAEYNISFLNKQHLATPKTGFFPLFFKNNIRRRPPILHSPLSILHFPFSIPAIRVARRGTAMAKTMNRTPKMVFTMVKTVSRTLKMVFTVVKTIFRTQKTIFTMVKTIFRTPMAIFTIVKTIFRTPKTIFTIVKTIFRTQMAIFTMVKTIKTDKMTEIALAKMINQQYELLILNTHYYGKIRFPQV